MTKAYVVIVFSGAYWLGFWAGIDGSDSGGWQLLAGLALAVFMGIGGAWLEDRGR